MTTPSVSPVTVYSLSGTTVGPFATSATTPKWGYEVASEVKVYVEADGIETLLTSGSQYTLTGTDTLTNGGSVTLNSGVVPSGGWAAGGITRRLVIRRATAEDQAQPFADAARFLPRATEDAYDKLTRLLQDLSAKSRRSVLVPEGKNAPVFPDKSAIADKYLYGDAAGNVLGGPSKSEFDADVAQAAADASAAGTARVAAEAAQDAAETAQAAAEAAKALAEAAAANTVRYDISQSRTDAEKLRARANQNAMARDMSDITWPAVISRGNFSSDLSGRFPYDFFGTMRINTGVSSASGGNHGNALFCHENSLDAGIISYPAALGVLGINKQVGGSIWAFYAEAHAMAVGGAVVMEGAGYRRTLSDAEQSPIHATTWNPPASQVKGISMGGTGLQISGGNYGTCTTAYETIKNGDTSIINVAGAPWANGYVNRPNAVTGFGFFQGATASLGAISGAWIETPGRSGDVALTLKLKGSQVAGRNIFEYRIASGTETYPENGGTNIRTGPVWASMDHFARLKLGPDATSATAHAARLVVSGNDTITSGARSIPNANLVVGLTAKPADTTFGASLVFSTPNGTGTKISALGAVGLGADLVLEGSTASAQYEALRVRGDRQAVQFAVALEFPTFTYATRPTASVPDGSRIFITDANVAAFAAAIVSGGGGNKVPAYYANAAWYVG